MPVALLTIEIQLPYAHSLKEKRAVLQKLQGRLRSRFNISVAELDHQDVWQRATVGIVSISGSRSLLESTLQRVLAEVENTLGHDVTQYTMDFL
jgi:uncharacterized protein YlxP (DUF503 family)